MTKVFIDGSAGTTGLRIYERLESRADIRLIRLSEELRKDTEARRGAINDADVVFLCLPDDAARESVSLCENPNTAIIDTSTAHRTAEGWVYGMSELDGMYKKIASSKRIANPGCHASGFISLIAPLVSGGIIDKSAELSCFSLTGYSGGGKKMIAQYEEADRSELLDAPGIYGLTQNHKHLPEMSFICGLEKLPIFAPIVAPYYSGMTVAVPIFADSIKGSASDIKEFYREYYKNAACIKYVDAADQNGFIYANSQSGYDGMEIAVCGNDERILLVSKFDNLGKGASGAAVQNMNILLGCDQTSGLNLPQ